MIALTKLESEEVLHRLCVLAETPDLQADYGLTQLQADNLLRSVPSNGGEWSIPAGCDGAVRGEMLDAASILRDQARDARSECKDGSALALCRLAKQIETKFRRLIASEDKYGCPNCLAEGFIDAPCDACGREASPTQP